MNLRKNIRPPGATTLKKLGLKKDWIAPWDLVIEVIERLGDKSWRIRTNRGDKILQREEWTEERARFICECLDHLGRNGFRNIPRFIKTIDDRRWVINKNGCFYLRDYLGRWTINIKDQEHQDMAFRELSKMHKLLKGLYNRHPELAALSVKPWNQQWEEDRKTLLLCRESLETKTIKTPFDSIFMEASDKIISQVDSASDLLWDTDYEYLRTDYSDTVCHGEYKETNLFLTPSGDLYIDRFDHCHYNLRVYDLGRFLYRVMAAHRWEIKIGERILEVYQELDPFAGDEKKILAAFLSYPHPSVSYVRAYFEQPEGTDPYNLVNGIRRESMRSKEKENFVEWLRT